MRRDGGFIAEIIHSFGMPESIVYALLVETVENELQQIFRQTFKLYRYHNRIQDGCYIGTRTEYHSILLRSPTKRTLT